MIYKTEANKSKQTIKPNKVTRVKIQGVDKFKATKQQRNLWEYTVQIELPRTGCPSVINLRFCRYPGTSKADYTGHDTITLDPSAHAGKTIWHTLAHSFLSGPVMPVALYIDHDGHNSIVLDGRQIKTN